MTLQQSCNPPLESRPPRESPCSSRASDDSDAHSQSNSDTAHSSHSKSHSSHHSDDPTGYPAGATLTEPDITNSMTVSSITSYITDSSMQKSPLGTEAPHSVTASPHHFPQAISPVPLNTFTTTSYNAPVLALDSLSSSRRQSPFTVPDTSNLSSHQEQAARMVPLYQASGAGTGYQQQPSEMSGAGPVALTSFQSMYPGHSHTFPPGSSVSTSQTHLPKTSSNQPYFGASAGNLASSLIPTGSTGSLQRDPNTDILLAEITRLRERLQTLETENTAMSLKLNQQQHDVEHRLAEIEMHFCGSDSVASGSDDHPPDGNKESVI